MRVGIIQSCYLPWRGYFDFINSVDLFIVFDDVQYPQGRSWRNRNRIKTPHGVKWMTVPVSARGKPMIDEVEIAETDKPWRPRHHALLAESLSKASHFETAIEIWKEGVRDDSGLLSQLNVRLLRLVCDYLGITTPIVLSRPYHARGQKTERLINLLEQVGATCYLSGPAARDYLQEQPFRDRGIRLEFKVYDYEPYPQLWGEFVDGLSVLDLIANVGPDSSAYLKSRSADVVAVP